ncbi:unnamed protein product [Sphagnum jensenii]|uniref:Uncharacterized protein n=1 Tax=Sphagnum jensenii TaxID=128206 RepID=A0ABP1A918_9BRYO
MKLLTQLSETGCIEHCECKVRAQLRTLSGNKMSVLDGAGKHVGVEFSGSKITGNEYVCYLQDGDGHMIGTPHQYGTRKSISIAEFYAEAGELKFE